MLASCTTCSKHPLGGYKKKSFWRYNLQLILASKKVIDYSYFLLLDYISLKGNKLVCFINSDGSLKVQDTAHDF